MVSDKGAGVLLTHQAVFLVDERHPASEQPADVVLDSSDSELSSTVEASELSYTAYT